MYVSDTKRDLVNTINNKTDIAVTGIGCWYPGAKNPKQLWENVLTRRREFRQFLDQRLPLSDYYDPDPNTPDKVYASRAAYIDDFQFDWIGRRIPKSTFEGTDIVQWLALEVADQAFKDAGYSRETIPRDKTGVIVGNSLTGEQSRANSMRLRWPFVNRSLIKAADAWHLPSDIKTNLSLTMEKLYKSVFPEVTEDTLQGGLSNTIAGRISNYFDLHGGGYNVDGACSSSLLAIYTAANNLANRDLDVALAGGVDVSLDTFELIGFSKTGALTSNDMTVYDERGDGFIPGEGSGFVVLKRLEDALDAREKIYAVIKGWGVSSDGKGGITAPSRDGQAYAIKRAYDKAGYRPQDLDFIEGHGTGTAVGDRIELEGIARAMSFFGDSKNRSCGITSFKSIVGHTKAAAGVGAFIKAVIAANRRVLPPTAGCSQPNKVFSEAAHVLYPITQGKVVDSTNKLRVGVSAMGFGGINSHITLESAGVPIDDLAPSIDERALLVSNQETELFVLGAQSIEELRDNLKNVARLSEGISLGDMTDLANELAINDQLDNKIRVAVIAGNPDDLVMRLNEAEKLISGENLNNKKGFLCTPGQDVWVSFRKSKSKLGILLPGQGSQYLDMGRVLVERYDWAQDFAERADNITLNESGIKITDYMFRNTGHCMDQNVIQGWIKDLSRTEIAQPSICFTSALYARHLNNLGLNPAVVGGHSLGELTAFHLAGFYDEEMLIKLAAVRGKTMAGASNDGAMASLATTEEKASEIISVISGYATIANINSPSQTVISGTEQSINEAISISEKYGVTATRLNVSGAFHSRFMEDASSMFKASLPNNHRRIDMSAIMLSCVDGEPVSTEVDLKEHLSSQIINQVNFIQLVRRMEVSCDLMLEVGPGRVLSGLVSQNTSLDGMLCLPVSTSKNTDTDLNKCLANAYIHGVNINWKELYKNRLVRKFESSSEKIFIDNPCEREPEEIDAVDSNLLRSTNAAAENDIEFKLLSTNDNAVPSFLETRLAQACNIQPGDLEKYISNRLGYLAEIVKTDIKSFSASIDKAVSNNNSIVEQVNEMKEIDSGKPDDIKIKIVSSNTLKEKSTMNVNIIENTLRDLVAEKTGFPGESITMTSRLLDDLNLDSIKAGELIANVAKTYNVTGKIDPSGLANATLEEIAGAIYQFVENDEQSNSQERAGEAVKETSEVDTDKIQNTIIRMIADRTGYPANSITTDSRLLDDLNLDSIKAGELIAAAAKEAGIAGKLDPSVLANAKISEIALEIKKYSFSSTANESKENLKTAAVANLTLVDNDIESNWVRNYVVKYVHESINSRDLYNEFNASKVLILSETYENKWVTSIKSQLSELGARVTISDFQSDVNNLLENPDYTHLITILPSHVQTDNVNEIQRFKRIIGKLQKSASIIAENNIPNLAFIQFGNGRFGTGAYPSDPEVCCTSGFARSISLDRPNLKIRVIDLDPAIDHIFSADKIINELSGNEYFKAVGYDIDRTRLVPRVQLQEPVKYKKRLITMSSDNVILVTGGAKGITAECTTELARITGAKIALVGSSPDPDKLFTSVSNEITDTINKIRSYGNVCNYYSCDISDLESVTNLAYQVKKELGNIDAIVHGAGANKPRRAEHVSTEEALAEISPKLLGIKNICQVLSSTPPCLIVGFSSIIGVTGMFGNAWYAYSNEALDLFLRRFESEHAETAVISIAYSVWGEAGMGKRLGVVDSLSKTGVGAISTAEGVSRFMKLFEYEPGDKQVIVTSTLTGLSTWKTLSKPTVAPQNYRFIDQIIRYEPGVELITKTRLTIDLDLYLKDHNFRGSYLFPTVFGLEAMSEAAIYLTGNMDAVVTKVENVDLSRPIPVDPKNGVEIELHAYAFELEGGIKKVHVGIRTEQTGFVKNHFSAFFHITTHAEDVKESLALNESLDLIEPPILLDAKTDLYGGLLFQGPLFQRMGAIYKLNENRVIFKTDYCDSFQGVNNGFAHGQQYSMVMGDPFYRDVLLQSAQLPATPEIVLPVAIGSIERFMNSTPTDDQRAVITQIKSREDKDIVFDVTVTDDQGQILERLLDYRVRVLETLKSGVSADELSAYAIRDENFLREILDQMIHEYELTPVSIALKYTPDIHSLSKDERHLKEIPIINRAYTDWLKNNNEVRDDFIVEWLPSGKPYFSGQESNKHNLSISHDNDYCLCVVGDKNQGCDLEIVKTRSGNDWRSLLGDSRFQLTTEITDKEELLDVAATRIWSSAEAAKKVAGCDITDLSVESIHDRAVFFKARTPDATYLIMTLPVNLLSTEDDKRIVALVVNKKSDVSVIERPLAINGSGSTQANISKKYQGFIFDRRLNQQVFEFEFQPTFKECANLSRGVFYTSYLMWIGKIRELFMSEIGPDLVPQISSGEWGLVTNWAEVKVFGEAQTYDRIKARFWLGKVANSVIPLHCDFYKILPDKSLEHIGYVEQETTWVKIIGHGKVIPAPFPKYFSDFLHFTERKEDQEPIAENFPESLSVLRKGNVLYEAPFTPGRSQPLHTVAFQTTLEDSNLVGNVYYGNYFVWQGRVRDILINNIVSECMRGIGENGEMLCLQSRQDYLRDAMPFDNIIVSISTRTVYECGVVFGYEFYRSLPDGSEEKLAVGEQEIAWVIRDKNGKPVSSPLPDKVRDTLESGIDEKIQKITA